MPFITPISMDLATLSIPVSNILSVSGGKDSTALWLLALERKAKFKVVFADTGNEHELTHEYLSYLSSKLGPITTVSADPVKMARRIEGKRKYVEKYWSKGTLEVPGMPDEVIRAALEVLHPTGNPFLDMCIWKGRFPSLYSRFCTGILKVEPIREQIVDPLLKKGNTVFSWQGVRASESVSRAKLNIIDQPDPYEEFYSYRPLIIWTAKDVFDMHRKYGIKWNPLYEHGMRRVGCMPCVNAGRPDIRHIASRFPEVIERIAKWEAVVSQACKKGNTTFMQTSAIKDWAGFPSGPVQTHSHGIRTFVRWAQTPLNEVAGRRDLYGVDKESLNAEECSSVYSLCE